MDINFFKDKNMKTYRVKKIYADNLKNLSGLLITPTECCNYVNINVFNYQATRFNIYTGLTCLPKNCDNRLVHFMLEQIQLDKTSFEQIERLKEYLKLAKQKDKNDKMKSDLKQSLKQISLNLLIILVSGLCCVGLSFLFTILSPMNASWMALCLLFVVGAATWSLLKVGVGCLTCGIEFFSICFRRKNTDRLPILLHELRYNYYQSLLPPSYDEVINNKIQASIQELYAEPPSYQQAIENLTRLSAYHSTPQMDIPDQVSCRGSSAHFTYPHSAFFAPSNRVVNDYPPPAYSRFCLANT